MVKPNELIRDDVLRMQAYEVPDSRGMIKLDAMENPHSLPQAIVEQWRERAARCELNRYPDPGSHELKQVLRETMHIAPEYEILLGNGSDELIQLVISAIAKPGAKVIAPAPSFVMYQIISEAARVPFVSFPLDEHFDLDPEAFFRVAHRERPALLFLASPNNPSGNLLHPDRLREAIAEFPGLVVIDEAYFAFADRHHDSWLSEFGNLLIMRTLSKLGLAGLRLGFLWGNPDWINELDKLRLPYNINSLTQAAAEISLRHFDELRVQTDVIRKERDRLIRALTDIRGLHPYPSAANFVLVRVTEGRARSLHSDLRDAGILVKCLDGTHPAVRNCLRITVGTRQENDHLMDVLRRISSRVFARLRAAD